VAPPSVSIFTSCRNGEPFLRRCLDSVLGQDCPDLEYVFQDGASTDGTLGILKEYQERHPGRIQLVSEPDSGPEEGFYRALRRCTGDIVGCCLVDEELLPGAVTWALEAFAARPDCAAVYGDYRVTDAAGGNPRIGLGAPFSLQRYLLHEVVPPFLTSFFRRRCLLPVLAAPGFGTPGIGEFELWLRLALEHPVAYRPGLVASYPEHPGRRSVRVAVLQELMAARMIFLETFFRQPGLAPALRSLAGPALGGLCLWSAFNLMAVGAFGAAREALQAALAHDPDPGWLLAVVEGWRNSYRLTPDCDRQACDAFHAQVSGYLERAFPLFPFVPPKAEPLPREVRRILWLQEGGGGSEAAERFEQVLGRFPGTEILALLPESAMPAERPGLILAHYPETAPAGPGFQRQAVAGGLRFEPDLVVLAEGAGPRWGAPVLAALPAPVKARLDPGAHPRLLERAAGTCPGYPAPAGAAAILENLGVMP
jgi:hypothetical protein